MINVRVFQGAFDLTLRLHNIPNMPPALLLERNLKPSLIPQHVLRTSQTEVLAYIAPLCISATATHVQGALDALQPFCNQTAEAAFNEATNSASKAASAVARALSSLALAAEIIRVVPNVLERLTATGARGQSLISNVSKLEFLSKPLVATMNKWLDSPTLRRRLSVVAEQLRKSRASLNDLNGSSGDQDALETARVAAVLARVSSAESKLANRVATPIPQLQLLALLQSNVDAAARNFHLSVCKSVHHPSSRNRRAGGNAVSQPVDASSGCILTASSRLCLAYLVQGRKTSLDRPVIPSATSSSDTRGTSGIPPVAEGGVWAPRAAATTPNNPPNAEAEGSLEEYLKNLSPREAFAAMQHLTTLADDVRMCLFEMRRRECFALALGYFNAIGGIQSVSARFNDAVKIAEAVHIKAEGEAHKEQQKETREANAAESAQKDAKPCDATTKKAAGGVSGADNVAGNTDGGDAVQSEDGGAMQTDGEGPTATSAGTGFYVLSFVPLCFRFCICMHCVFGPILVHESDVLRVREQEKQ